MKNATSLLHFTLVLSITWSACACNQVNNNETKTAADTLVRSSSASNNSASMVSTIIDGHEIKVDTNNPNVVMIDGQKVNVAYSSMSKEPLPDSLKNGKAYTSVVDGKKVTAYHKFMCPKPSDSQRVKSSVTH